jgi:uncharacterized protein
MTSTDRSATADSSTLKERLHADMTAAMKARDTLSVTTLRLTLAAVTTAEVAGAKAVILDDDDVTSVIAAEAKKRHEAADLYADAGQDERAEAERAEAAVLERYLPAALTDDALAAIIAEEVARVAEAGTTGPKAMGAVIAAVRGRAGAGTDGARVAAAVKDALAPR